MNPGFWQQQPDPGKKHLCPTKYYSSVKSFNARKAVKIDRNRLENSIQFSDTEDGVAGIPGLVGIVIHGRDAIKFNGTPFVADS